MPRYFFGENAGRPIRVGSHSYTFDILSVMGGTQQGVVAVPDDEVEAFLSVASKWVQEIPETEYVAALQKKKTDRRSRPSPDLAPPQPLGPPLKGRGAVVVDGKDFRTEQPTDSAPEKIDDAIDLGRADVPPDTAPTKKSTRRENHQVKRGTKAAA
jgi:hypothetical protein